MKLVFFDEAAALRELACQHRAAQVPGRAVLGLIRSRISRQRRLFNETYAPSSPAPSSPAPPAPVLAQRPVPLPAAVPLPLPAAVPAPLPASSTASSDGGGADRPATSGLAFWLDGHHPSGAAQALLARRLSAALADSGI